MRIVGLIGGLSWESTVTYYSQINQTVRQRLGGLHSARLILYSLDFQPIERLMQTGDWNAAGLSLAAAARTLEKAGAQGLILCTNTLHLVAPAIEAAVGIPLLHIIDATAADIRRAGAGTIGLLGTRFTMEQPFYRERLEDRHGIKVLTPSAADRELAHGIIFEELCVGRLLDASRAHYRRMMQQLVAQGAQAIVLGCTELSLLIRATDVAVPLLDTTAIHARAAAEWLLAG